MKPCPFCTAGPDRLHVEATRTSSLWTAAVVCRDCDCRGPARLGSTPEIAEAHARRDWDRRAEP